MDDSRSMFDEEYHSELYMEQASHAVLRVSKEGWVFPAL